MCKIKLSAKGYESSEQFLNTLILNYQKMPFTAGSIKGIMYKDNRLRRLFAEECDKVQPFVNRRLFRLH